MADTIPTPTDNSKHPSWLYRVFDEIRRIEKEERGPFLEGLSQPDGSMAAEVAWASYLTFRADQVFEAHRPKCAIDVIVDAAVESEDQQ